MDNAFINRIASVHNNFAVLDSKAAVGFLQELLELLFPHFGRNCYFNADVVKSSLDILQSKLNVLLTPLISDPSFNAKDISQQFFDKLPQIYEALIADAEAIYRGDPAANSIDEVIIAYPGFYAIAVYRIAHEFYTAKIPSLPRLLSEFAHQKTGIDIHPGATIGRNFCIDHGTGIVIGETTEIGDNVKLYQGVTLGALSVEKSLASKKRHPTIEDEVVIYAHATILGGNTRIGKGSTIGGNVWLTKSVAAGSTVYYKSDNH